MDGSTILLIMFVAIFVWIAFFRKIKPASKTDDQLWVLHRTAVNAGEFGIKRKKLIEKEMEKRGLLNSTEPKKDNAIEAIARNNTVETDVDLSELSNTLDVLSIHQEVLAEVSPISRQLQYITDNLEVPEGGIFDSYTRGYFFGFLDSLIEKKGGRGIDHRPDMATDILNIMFGAAYTGENEGMDFFNECLADRRTFKEHKNSVFNKGVSEGKSDFENFVKGAPSTSMIDFASKMYDYKSLLSG